MVLGREQNCTTDFTFKFSLNLYFLCLMDVNNFRLNPPPPASFSPLVQFSNLPNVVSTAIVILLSFRNLLVLFRIFY